MFDWEDMRAFLALAKSGSFVSAGRALGVNHATIGRRITALEASLDVALIDREGRGTALTAAGMSVAEQGLEMQEAAASVLVSARPRGGLTGAVMIASPPVLAGAFVIPALAPLRDANPQLLLSVSAVPALASVERRDADLAIRLIRPDQPLHQLRRLGSMEYALYAAPEIAALPREEWGFIGYDGELDHLTQQRWLADYAGQRPMPFRTMDMLGQLAATRAAMGVALLPRFIAEEAPGLVRVDPGAVTPRRSIWLSVHSGTRKSPAVRAAADHLETIFLQSRHFSADAEE